MLENEIPNLKISSPKNMIVIRKTKNNPIFLWLLFMFVIALWDYGVVKLELIISFSTRFERNFLFVYYHCFDSDYFSSSDYEHTSVPANI